MPVRTEPSPKWIRARKDGRIVVDSTRALVVWRRPGPPFPIAYAFPPEDVQGAPSEPLEDHPDHVLVPWDAVDEWLEDDEVLVGHVRDPRKRIDVRRSSRHVVVMHRGEVLADSRRPWMLYETGLPVRFYLPPEDVHLERMQESSTRTTCAYKGHADHFSHDGVDVAWVYRDPLFDAPPIKDRIAFYGERVEISIDGRRQDAGHTEWSTRA